METFKHVMKLQYKEMCSFISLFHVSEKLHVLSNPESKARRHGQTAAFCCKVAGTPEPDKYQWWGLVILTLHLTVIQCCFHF